MKWLLDSSTSNGFSVCSYNVLANSYIKPKWFPWSSKQALNWPFRWKNLKEELSNISSDIYCLQEVDEFETFEKFFKSIGYASFFKKRTGYRNDGCAIFIRKSKFNLITKIEINFNDLTNNKAFQQDNIALFLVLESTADQKSIIIGTSHIYYKDPSVKQIQLQQYVQRANQLQQEWNSSIILTGDLNINSDSPLLDLIAKNDIVSFDSVYNGNAVAKFFYLFLIHILASLKTNKC